MGAEAPHSTMTAQAATTVPQCCHAEAPNLWLLTFSDISGELLPIPG